MRVIINPGHGGKDSGAISPNWMKEKKVNLNVALHLRGLLTAAGHQVIMTRTDDTFTPLKKLRALCLALHPDLIISIHHNAGGGHGFDVIYQIAGGESKRLAELIAAEFLHTGQTQHRVFSRKSLTRRGRNYYTILDHTTPAVITEFCFMDSEPKEIDTLKEQWAEAAAIAIAVKKYEEGIKNG